MSLVRFPIDEPRGERYEVRRYDLFHEDDATSDITLDLPANVEAKIYLFECAHRESWDESEKFVFAEVKRNNADERLSLEEVELESRWNEWLKNFGRNLIVDDNKVSPPGSKKGEVHREIVGEVGWVGEPDCGQREVYRTRVTSLQKKMSLTRGRLGSSLPE